MKKNEVIAKMAEKASSTKVDAAKFLDAFLLTLDESIKNNDPMNLAGYFSINIVDMPSRACRNLQTGESMMSRAKKIAKVKLSPYLKNID
jgi:DNA-binding protein HU-beta